MSHKIKTTTPHHMGREKVAPAKSAGAIKAAKGVPLIVVCWAFGLGVFGYLVSRFVVSQHPLHWVSLVGGVLLGIVIGYVWYLTRGDVGLV